MSKHTEGPKKKRVAWNKGKGNGWVDKRGYRWFYTTQNGRRRAIKAHRLIMEQHLGRKLEPWEIVHHIDNDVANNNLENLKLTNHSEHTISHHIGTKRPEAAKKAIRVFAQLREEIHHLRRVVVSEQEIKADLLAACKTVMTHWNLPRYIVEEVEAAIAKAEEEIEESTQ